MYSEETMKHFKNPQNMGEMESPDGTGEVGNPTCGDMMYCYIRVVDGIIKDIKVKTFGCVAAIATSSIMTELVKGMTVKEAKNLTNKDVADALKGLPPIKMHCSNLAAEALHKAIDDYEAKNK